MKIPHVFRRCGFLTTALLTITFTPLAVERSAFAQDPIKQTNATQGLEELPELVSGVPLSREIKGGEAHSFRVTLTSGQYVRVGVEQRGIDLVVKVFGPDGQQLAEVDSPNGEHGPELVSLLAGIDGTYRFEIRALKKDASKGGYDIRIAALREATAQDRSLTAAQTAYAEGDRARSQKNRQEALKKYEEALTLYRAAFDRPGEIATLDVLASGYTFLGEKQKALGYYDQELQLHRLTGNRSGEANTLHSIGAAYNSYQNAVPGMEERLKALEYFDQAVAASKVAGDQKLEAFTLTEIGGVYNALEERQKALEYFNQALQIQETIGDRRRAAYTLNYIAGSYKSFGERQKALEYFHQAAILHKAENDRFGEATTLTETGAVYYLLGEPQKALEYFNQALPLHRATPNRGWEASTLTQMGAVYYSVGENQKALEYLNQALPIQKDLHNSGWQARTLTYIGAVYNSLGDWQKALEYLNQALNLSRVTPDPSGEANVLLNIARVERDRNNLPEARHSAETALRIIESLRTTIVSQDLRASYLASKRDYYEFYIDVLMRLHREAPSKGNDAAALQASERAHARSLLETLNEAHVDIRQGVDPKLLERERALQRQINVAELRRARALNGKPTQEQAQTMEKELSALLAAYTEVQAEIRARSPRYAALTQPVPLSLREIQQQVIDDDTLLLEYALGEEKTYLWVLSRTELKSFVLPKRSVVEAEARRAYELLMASSKIEAKRAAELAVAELSRMVLGPASGLLGKKRILIVGDGALQYVPFAALPVPSSQSLANGITSHSSGSYEPLIARHEVISLPSASVLAVLRREISGRQPAPQALAVLADAVFQSNDPRLKTGQRKAHVKSTPDPDDQLMVQSDLMRSAAESGISSFQRLPFSRREAEAIVAQAGEPRSLKALDFLASRETVFDTNLDQYRIIHFATHGLLNSQHPELSGVVLSLFDEQGRPVDGFLRAHEIYNIKLNADLVVLSACRTASGKEIKGEGLVGLTRGFMYAGAASVVASLWDVRDEATSELMSRFYEKMFKEGLTPAAALRAAQVSMWNEKRWEAPYYWAGFMLQGEWR